MFYSWLCAKSGRSIPSPSVLHHPIAVSEHGYAPHHITVHLPNEDAAFGLYNGKGELLVERAWNLRGEDLDPDEHPSLRDAGGSLLNIELATARLLSSKIQSLDDLARTEEMDDIKVVVVHAEDSNAADMYERLPASPRCPAQGHFYNAPELVDAAYFGNADKAWLAECGPQYPGANWEDQLDIDKANLTSFLTLDIERDQLAELVSGEATVNELLASYDSGDGEREAPFIGHTMAEMTLEAVKRDAKYGPLLNEAMQEAKHSPTPG